MNVREALKICCRTLADAGMESAALDAEVLLAFVLHGDRSMLLQSPERVLADADRGVYTKLIQRRARREPVAYLTGHKMFYGRTFAVNSDVLIPRPESELLIETCLKTFPSSESLTIADIGTGSGCLAVTLALEKPQWTIIATDISEKALVVAQQNATAHGVAKRVSFRHGDLLEPVREEQLDVIVANLPYVPNGELASNPDLAFEPIIALRGAHVPQRTFGWFLEQWNAREQQPVVLLEIHPNLRGFLESEAQQINARVEFVQDLAGRDRVAVVQPFS